MVILSNQTIYDNSGKAAAIAYAETSIGATYRFGAKSDSNTTAYIIPTPAELSTNTNARWLSDVVTITPSCSFAQTNISEPINLLSNASAFSSSFAVNLPDVGIDLVINLGDCMSVFLFSGL
jgi:hypothetical protein